jgi:hypothetical protein
MSSTGSSPFAFSHATATPQNKRTSTRKSHETRSTGNVERTTASSSSPDAPISAVSPTSSVPSPNDVTTWHTHTPTPSSYRRWLPMSLDSTKSCLPYTSGRSHSHEATTNVRGAPSAAVSEHWAAPPRKSYWSLTEDDRASRLGQPHPMAHSRHANARTLLAHLLHLHLSRVLGHHFLAHATAVQPPSHESAVLSAPAPVCGIQAQIQVQVQVQATVGVRDTIPMS